MTVDHVEGFPGDYAETLRHWARRLDEHLDEAFRVAGAERCRVWRLYLRGARNGFETGFTSVYQVNCRLRDDGSPRERQETPLPGFPPAQSRGA